MLPSLSYCFVLILFVETIWFTTLETKYNSCWYDPFICFYSSIIFIPLPLPHSLKDISYCFKNGLKFPVKNKQPKYGSHILYSFHCHRLKPLLRPSITYSNLIDLIDNLCSLIFLVLKKKKKNSKWATDQILSLILIIHIPLVTIP